MTPCAQKGYKVGDAFRLTKKQSDYNDWEAGTVITLDTDDGSQYPLFSCNGEYAYSPLDYIEPMTGRPEEAKPKPTYRLKTADELREEFGDRFNCRDDWSVSGLPNIIPHSMRTRLSDGFELPTGESWPMRILDWSVEHWMHTRTSLDVPEPKPEPKPEAVWTRPVATTQDEQPEQEPQREEVPGKLGVNRLNLLDLI